MSNLNYSRELYLYAKKFLAIGAPVSDRRLHALIDAFESICKLHHKSVKFTLPNGGRLENFKSGKADIEGEINLPFKSICLEYCAIGSVRKDDEPYMYIEGVPQYVEEDTSLSPKRLVYAVDTGATIEITVAYTVIEETDKSEVWVTLPVVALNKETREFIYPSVFITPFSDYADEIGALLLFIKALSCSNVKIDKMAPTVKGKANVKRNGFIPYDSYHVLTIDLFNPTQKSDSVDQHGTHASPREHLRRGHIRTLASGKKVWVNDTVVNKGAPNAVIKTYEMV
jgi:hypothetical protein